MPFINPKTIMEAKKMDLLTYLRTYEPEELIHFSKNVYCTKTHDSLKISNGRWYWHSRGIGGRSALDYLIKVKRLAFLEAVEQITGQAANQPPVFLSASNEVKREPFLLPQRDYSQSMLERYLRKRGISYEVIHYFLDHGLIYQNFHQGFYNLVFVGKDPQNVPRYASIRGISSDFKGDVTGSDKRYSFSYSCPDSEQLHIFESAIDLMSYATLNEFSALGHFSGNLLSLSGIFSSKQNQGDGALPPALARYMSDYPQISHIYLHLDNDLAGQQATQAITSVLANRCTIWNEPPLSGKDYNDYLCRRLGLPLTQRKAGRNELMKA